MRDLLENSRGVNADIAVKRILRQYCHPLKRVVYDLPAGWFRPENQSLSAWMYSSPATRPRLLCEQKKARRNQAERDRTLCPKENDR